MKTKAEATGTNLRRVGPRKIAEAIAAREAHKPGFWADVQKWVTKAMAESAPARVAQVMPRGDSAARH